MKAMTGKSFGREELRAFLDKELDAARFRDYCPNGLQVEGSEQIRRVVCGVTASKALIEAAIERQADALLVHHGWFWKSEDGRVTGFRKQRMARLLAHDISLFAYHLPLDAHPVLGNNAQLAVTLGWTVDRAIRGAGHRIFRRTTSADFRCRVGAPGGAHPGARAATGW
jgi:putative NIF3 family GTP cyclohydrolase 1 type 2